MNSLRVALGVPALLATMGALADVQVVQGSFALPTGSGSLTQNFDVDPFDTDLGFLTGVSVSFAPGSIATVRAGGFVVEAGAGTFAVVSSASFVLRQAGQVLISTAPISDSFVGSMASVGAVTNPLGSTVLLGNPLPFMTSSGLSPLVGEAGAQTSYTVEFVGTAVGALPGSVTSYGGLTRGSTGRVFVGGDAAARGAINVSYTYTAAVPEPSTYALMAAGLGVIGIAWRRRPRA